MIFWGGTCVGWAQVKATGEVAGGGKEEGLAADVWTGGEGRLSMMFWNVCGWERRW